MALTVLSACSTRGDFSKSRCPELPEYTDEFQKGASEELRRVREAHIDTPNVRILLRDFGLLRAECRSLQSSSGGSDDLEG